MTNNLSFILQDHGVSHVFTLIGGHISPIIVAAEQLGIRIIDTRHEVSSVLLKTFKKKLFIQHIFE